MNLRKLILTNNACYKADRTIVPKGIMVHSTGANNPWLKRYVGPDDGLLGKNTNNNHWNQDCSDRCRHAWWSAHRDRLNRRAIYHMSCAHCGKPFDSYGNKDRKYCCHACYIAGRFGEEVLHGQGAI